MPILDTPIVCLACETRATMEGDELPFGWVLMSFKRRVVVELKIPGYEGPETPKGPAVLAVDECLCDKCANLPQTRLGIPDWAEIEPELEDGGEEIEVDE